MLRKDKSRLRAGASGEGSQRHDNFPIKLFTEICNPDRLPRRRDISGATNYLENKARSALTVEPFSSVGAEGRRVRSESPPGAYVSTSRPFFPEKGIDRASRIRERHARWRRAIAANIQRSGPSGLTAGHVLAGSPLSRIPRGSQTPPLSESGVAVTADL